MFDVPCLLSTMWGNIDHSSALLGLKGDLVVVGEPQMGLVRTSKKHFDEKWKWDGYAVVIAPDFLHDFHVMDKSKRCLELWKSLESLGYEKRSKETLREFQSDHHLEPTGRLDWRTILVIDALTGPAERPHLSTYLDPAEEDSEE
jgi:hypothetical protein